jgi:transposase
MEIAVLGIDLGKNSCSLVGLDAVGKISIRRRMRRETVIAFCAKLPACIVAMEACCGAHHTGRAMAAQGDAVRLMSPEYVRPYVKAQKNDDRDAEAIAEAATRPTMRFVELKSEEQLDVQTLHRVRDQLVGERTSLMNQIRSLLLERGQIIAQGRAKLAIRLEELLAGEAPSLSGRMSELISDSAIAGGRSIIG